jgi:hypothetical protein
VERWDGRAAKLTLFHLAFSKLALFHGTALSANRSVNGRERKTKTGRQRKDEKPAKDHTPLALHALAVAIPFL